MTEFPMFRGPLAYQAAQKQVIKDALRRMNLPKSFRGSWLPEDWAIACDHLEEFGQPEWADPRGERQCFGYINGLTISCHDVLKSRLAHAIFIQHRFFGKPYRETRYMTCYNLNALQHINGFLNRPFIVSKAEPVEASDPYWISPPCPCPHVHLHV